jgi:hypothetical protein
VGAVSQRIPVSDTERDYILTTYKYLNVQQQAVHLQCSYHRVMYIRRLLSRKKSIPLRTKRRWTYEEEREMVDALRHGHSIAKVAHMMQRPINAITHCALRYGGIRVIRSGPEATERLLAVRTESEVARLFGISRDRVHRWIKYGYLRYNRRSYVAKERNGIQRKYHYRITDEAVMDFIGMRDYWMLWNPEKLQDSDWQSYANERRNEEPGFWISAVRFARERNYHPYTGQKWVEDGILPAVKVNGLWWVWSEDEAVKNFVPPLERV